MRTRAPNKTLKPKFHKPAKHPASHRVAALFSDNPEEVVEAKLAELVRDPRYWKTRDPAFLGHVTRQFERVYGTDPVTNDATGRTIQPKPKRFDIEPFHRGGDNPDPTLSAETRRLHVTANDAFDAPSPLSPHRPARRISQSSNVVRSASPKPRRVETEGRRSEGLRARLEALLHSRVSSFHEEHRAARSEPTETRDDGSPTAIDPTTHDFELQASITPVSQRRRPNRRWGPTSTIPPFSAEGMQFIIPGNSAQSPLDELIANEDLGDNAPDYLTTRDIDPDTGDIVITVPEGYWGTPADNGRGIRLVPIGQLQRDHSEIRMMMPIIEIYPSGYIVYYDHNGRRISPFSGRSVEVSESHYHFSWRLFEDQLRLRLFGWP
jgi:hypothetical protein